MVVYDVSSIVSKKRYVSDGKLLPKYVNGKGRFLEICYEEKWIYFGDKRYLNIRVNLGSEGRRDRVDRFSASLSKWFGETD